MRDFAILLRRVWRDPAFVELDNDARLLFLWLWTQPRAAISGLYRVSTNEMTAALDNGRRQNPSQWCSPEQRVWISVEALAEKPLVHYDFDLDVVWVVRRAHHSNRSAAARRLMAGEYRRCSPSPLKAMFYAEYAGALGLPEET